MSLGTLQKLPGGSALLWRLASGRADDTVGHFRKQLRPGETILDIGAGICDIALRLQRAGFAVTALDVADYSCTPLVRPHIYDGQHMPFKKRQFDTALLLTMLHHIPAAQHEELLREAGRVAKQIVIIEDVYTSRWHKYATWLIDSFYNLEFLDHPHSNRTDKQWRKMFAELGWNITHEKSWHSTGVLQHRMYVLKP